MSGRPNKWPVFKAQGHVGIRAPIGSEAGWRGGARSLRICRAGAAATVPGWARADVEWLRCGGVRATRSPSNGAGDGPAELCGQHDRAEGGEAFHWGTQRLLFHKTRSCVFCILWEHGSVPPTLVQGIGEANLAEKFELFLRRTERRKEGQNHEGQNRGQ
jgi:hypothetical protein